MKTKDITIIGISASIICVTSPIAIPMISGVPITLQTIIIPLMASIIGKKKGLISTLIYVLIGLIGIPVFSGYKGGIGAILSPTGGFILSFPLMAYIGGYFFENYKNKLMLYIGVIISNVINYVVGIMWFMWFVKMPLKETIIILVVPYILVTIIKIIITVEVGKVVKKNYF